MRPTGRRLVWLSLAALGVVYGDIGTSPLYAFRECFKPEYGLAPTASNVYGVLSLIVWSLILIVSVKYLVLIIRLDNRGEGGIMALLALVLSIRRRQAVIAIGLFGAALLYGDGIITPAISVLSATEGLGIAAPAFQPYVMPAALVLLFLLFSVQKYGTAGVGGVFGPIMLVWFTTIGLLGAIEIVRAPAILLALNPWYGARLFWEHRAAAVVASQALISVAFSLTQQSIHLRYLPRLSIIHTSRSEFGQIYVPAVNTALIVGCLLLVIGFRSSSALAAAYGVAVTGTMAVTTLLFFLIARHRWHWSPLRAGALAGSFLFVDLAFFGANIIKIDSGGWVALCVAGVCFLVMATWYRGTQLV